MALIKCPECNKEISDKAVSCPNCGFPIEITNQEDIETADIVIAEPTGKPKTKKMLIKMILGISVIGIITISVITYFTMYYIGGYGKYAVENTQNIKKHAKRP